MPRPSTTECTVAFGALLVAWRWEMPDHAAETHETALAFMQYLVNTIYGISDAIY